MADEAEKQSGPETKKLEQEAARLAAETNRINAETNLLNAEAKKEQAASTATVDHIAKLLETIKATEFKGSVELGSDAGKLEAHLLTAEAVSSIAASIAQKIGNEHRILVISSKDTNPVQSLLALESAQTNIKAISAATMKSNWLVVAQTAYNKAKTQHNTSTNAAGTQASFGLTSIAQPVAIIGEALEAGSKLLTYFKTDFTLSSITVQYDDDMLLTAIAGKLNATVATPTSLAWASEAADIDVIINAFKKEAMFMENFEQDVLALESAVSRFHKLIEDSQPDNKSDLLELLNEANDNLNLAKERIKEFATEAAAYFVGLGVQDSVLFIGKLLPALAIKRFVDGDATNTSASKILRVKSEYSGGSAYKWRNVWSGISGAPYRVAGGIVASYALIDASTGFIEKAGVEKVHGGFKGLRETASLFSTLFRSLGLR